MQENKANSTNACEKANKLEIDNDKMKKELRELKRVTSTHQDTLNTRRQSNKTTNFAYESKENKIDWVHRNISIKKEDK